VVIHRRGGGHRASGWWSSRVGVVGIAANAIVLYAMVASKQHKKQVLVFNQNALAIYTIKSRARAPLSKKSGAHTV